MSIRPVLAFSICPEAANGLPLPVCMLFVGKYLQIMPVSSFSASAIVRFTVELMGLRGVAGISVLECLFHANAVRFARATPRECVAVGVFDNYCYCRRRQQGRRSNISCDAPELVNV
jgi:hypothetical protein